MYDVGEADAKEAVLMRLSCREAVAFDATTMHVLTARAVQLFLTTCPLEVCVTPTAGQSVEKSIRASRLS